MKYYHFETSLFSSTTKHHNIPLQTTSNIAEKIYTLITDIVEDLHAKMAVAGL